MICLSAISVSVRRLIESEETITDITGSESGSTFVITGGSSCGGTFFIALATFSRTSLAASLRSRSRTKRTVIDALPSFIRADSSSMPATPLSASSIGSTTDVAIFDDTNAAKQALLNGQIDGLVADLDTALYISAVQISGSEVVGQFETTTGTPEEFGLLFQKGNPLVSCVNTALDALHGDGTLSALEAKWLDKSANIPVLE